MRNIYDQIKTICICPVSAQHLPYFNVNRLSAGKFALEIGRSQRGFPKGMLDWMDSYNDFAWVL